MSLQATEPPAIEVERLGKRYQLGGRADYGRQAYARLGEALAGALSRRVRRAPRREADHIWALSEVSFSVAMGEIVGVIGGNGAGKSTLLKILARITEPTTGEARLHGRVGSLLEVGTGFHPELSGRENVYMAGSILGMRTAEVRRRFEEIVEFAELSRFLDTPVKHYSSGMYIRLAFAVAAHFEPEILLVDEVLAVGDVAFQQRCLGKMSEVSRSGRTVLFVSHNMAAVRQLCARGIVIHDGRVDFDGDAEAAVERYLARQARGAPRGGSERRFGPEGDSGRGWRARSVRLCSLDGEQRASFAPSEPVVVEVRYELDRPMRNLRHRLFVCTPDEVPLFVATDQSCRGALEGPGRFLSRLVVQGGLFNTRRYVVDLEAERPGEDVLLERTRCVEFSVAGPGNQDSTSPEGWPGLLCPAVGWELAADAPGEPGVGVAGAGELEAPGATGSPAAGSPAAGAVPDAGGDPAAGLSGRDARRPSGASAR